MALPILVAFCVSALPAVGPSTATVGRQFRYIDGATGHVQLAVAGRRIAVAFVGRLEGEKNSSHWLATAAGGRWKVIRLGSPRQSGMPQLSRWPLLAAERHIFVAYHDPASDHWIFGEVAGGRVVSAASIERKHLEKVGPVPRAMACYGRYVWVADERAVARLYRTQWQELVMRGKYIGKPLDMIVVGGKPIVLGEYWRIWRLKSSPSAWQELESWEVVPPKNTIVRVPRDLPSRSWVLQGDGRRIWCAGWQTGSRGQPDRLLVAWAPVGATRKEQWRILERSLPVDQLVGGARLVRMPSGPPSLVVVQRPRSGGAYSVLVYPLTARAIRPPRTIAQLPDAVGVGSPSLAVAANDAGQVFAAVVAFVGDEKQVLVVGDKALWSEALASGSGQGAAGGAAGGHGPSGQAAGQQEAAGQAVGGGRPDFVPVVSVSGGSGGPPRRLSKGYAHLRVQAKVLNKGDLYKGPLTIRYEIGDVKVFLHVTGSGSNRPTAPAGSYLYAPTVEFRPEHRPSSQSQLRRKYSWLDADGKTWRTSTRPPTIHRNWSVGSAWPRIIIKGVVPVGKDWIRVSVDPDNRVRELSEKNNEFEEPFVLVDTRAVAHDGGTPAAGRNDLAIFQPIIISPEEELHQPGLVQGRVSLAVWIVNPDYADWFEGVTLRVSLDRRTMSEVTVPALGRDGTVSPRMLPGGMYSGKKLSAVLVPVELDLSSVSLGRHVLKLELDPEDRLGDLRRANNVYVRRIMLRERGGTLRVSTLDRATRQPIERAHVFVWGKLPGDNHRVVIAHGVTDATGTVTLPDIPPGNYPDGAIRTVKYKNVTGVEYARTAGHAFTIRSRRTTAVVVFMERPVDVTVRVVDATTGQPPDYSARVWIDDEAGWVGRKPARFHDIAPGEHQVRVAAYAYKPYSAQVAIHGDANARMSLEIRLTPAPRGTLKVICRDDKNKPAEHAYVDVRHTPVGGWSDATGTATMTQVEAGKQYWVAVRKAGYVSALVKTPAVPADGTVTVNAILPKLTFHKARISFRAITWAQMERWEGFSVPLSSASQPTYKVTAQYGEFYADLVLHYHKPRSGMAAGQVYVDELFATFTPGIFWQTSCSFEYDPSDLIGGVIGKVSKGGEEAWELFGNLLTAADAPNKFYDAFTGEQGDPNQLKDGVVYGAWETHSGYEYESASFYPVPDFSFDVGGTVGGGKTIVIIQGAEVTDGSTTVRINPYWESPGLMYWWLQGKVMVWDKVRVKLYLRVLDENHSPSLLGLHSYNMIEWQPSKKNALRMQTWER